MHARLDAGAVRILTRRGNDWTGKYPAIAEAITFLPARAGYLDGEPCGVLPDARTAFNLIQNVGRTVGDYYRSSGFAKAADAGSLPAALAEADLVILCPGHSGTCLTVGNESLQIATRGSGPSGAGNC